MKVIMGLAHVKLLQYYVPTPKKESVENHVSGDKAEIETKVTYNEILTGILIGSAD